ncbi:MAG TPA: hypothetical protein VGB76_03150 [Pyrinomonadaceae bacterium]|jgi:hypothetical protein
MSTWNYRVARRNGEYGVYAAYYNDDGTIVSLSRDPLSPTGDSPDELRTQLELLLESLDAEVVDYASIADNREKPDDL